MTESGQGVADQDRLDLGQALREIGALVDRQQWGDALRALGPYREQGRTDPDFWRYQALALRGAGELSQAQVAADRWASLAPGVPALRYRAELLEARGKHFAAGEVAEEWARAAPDDVDAWLTTARNYKRAGLRDRARTAVERAVQLAPGNSDALALAGEIELTSGHADRAVQRYDAALAADPDSGALAQQLQRARDAEVQQRADQRIERKAARRRRFNARTLLAVGVVVALAAAGWFVVAREDDPEVLADGATATGSGDTADADPTPTTPIDTSPEASAGGEAPTGVAFQPVERLPYRAGDCARWDDDEEGTREGRLVPCDEPHTDEIYAVFDLDGPAGAPYPDEVAIDAAAERCIAELEGYLGYPFNPHGRFFASLLRPSEEGWAVGDRQVTCVLQLSASVSGRLGAPFEGAVRDRDQSFVFPVGTCVGSLAGFPEFQRAPVDCGGPHFQEVVGHATLEDSGGRPPTADEQWAAARAQCAEALETYRPGRMLPPGEAVASLTIVEDAWLSGARTTECVVGSWDDGAQVWAEITGPLSSR